jgi:hypothetical protein
MSAILKERATVARRNELVAAALSQPKTTFVAEHPFYFLLPLTPLPTAGDPLETSFAATAKEAEVAPARADELRVLALRKKISLFEDMITVGRTANNDIVIGHASISRLHAYFRGRGRALELTDTGSFNGTWVNESRLRPRMACRLAAKDVIRFADLRLRLVDAASCWEELQRVT